MSFWQGIKTLIDNTIQQYTRPTWASVEKKFTRLIEVLGKLRGKDDHRLASDLLQEVLVYLENNEFSVSSYSNQQDSQEYDRMRHTLLNLWYHLLNGVYSCEAHEANYYRTIILIVNREEFGVARLSLDSTFQPNCNENDLAVAHRYRVLLYHTQMYVMTKLTLLERNQDLSGTSGPFPDPFHQFAAKVCAVTFIRLPGIAQRIINAIGLSAEKRKELMSFLDDPSDLDEAFYGSNSSALFPDSSTTRTTFNRPVSRSSFPLPLHPPSEVGSPSLNQPSSSPELSSTTQPTLNRVTPSTDSVNRDLSAQGDAADSQTTSDKQQEADHENSGANATAHCGSNCSSEIAAYGESPSDSSQENCSLPSSPDSSSAIEGTGSISSPQNKSLGPSEHSVIEHSEQPINKRSLLLKLIDTFPNLFLWNQFHAAVIAFKVDSEDDKLRRCQNTWLQRFNRRDYILFFPFLSEWVNIVFREITRVNKGVPSQKPSTPLQWMMLQGYRHLIEAFVYEFHKNYRTGFSYSHPKTFNDAAIALLRSNPRLINVYMRFVFRACNVYDTVAVLDVLNRFEHWLKVVGNVPQDFDHQFCTKAFDIICETDLHQLIVKLLVILYNHSESFTGEPRKALYIDFLLRRHFFDFFLHWESTVRNTFQQLLVFKALRIKRSQLHGHGFKVRELASTRVHESWAGVDDINSQLALDAILFAKIESYIRMLQDQMRDPNFETLYPARLEVYVPKALLEYKTYMSMYYQWEQTEKEPPQLMPLSLIKDAEPGPASRT